MNKQQDLANRIINVGYEADFAKIVFNGSQEIKTISKTLKEIGINEIVRSISIVSSQAILKNTFILKYQNSVQKDAVDALIVAYRKRLH